MLTRGKNNREQVIASFREIFEEFNKCCTKNISPDDYIAIDKILYPTKGVRSFKRYNEDKPAKYGLNFRSMDKSRRPYIYYTVPYTRNTVEVTESHKKNRLTLVKKTVEDHKKHGYPLKGTNISKDRY